MIVVDVVSCAVIYQRNLLIAPVNIFTQRYACAVEYGDELAGFIVVIKTLINSLLSELTYPSYAHEYIVGRYLELLCARSVGDYIESNRASGSGWLHAIKNPMAAKVIGAIHAQPEYPWSVSAMAKLCHLSPSRFAARFSEILGMGPMMYVTQCRMYVASTLLLLPQSSIEKITLTMGYENVAAFKRIMGVSPGLWRKINQPQESSICKQSL
jgi:AraC-like DNA-binding protein